MKEINFCYSVLKTEEFKGLIGFFDSKQGFVVVCPHISVSVGGDLDHLSADAEISQPNLFYNSLLRCCGIAKTCPFIGCIDPHASLFVFGNPRHGGEAVCTSSRVTEI